jgi:hypothetical protein
MRASAPERRHDVKISRSILSSACIALSMAASLPALAADKPCTKADAAAGEKAIERVNNWGQMYKAWQDYRQCDTGAVADAYTDTLFRLFVEWKGVDALAASMKKDAQYHDWVHARLKSPAAKDDQPAVYSRVRASCPSGMDAFCSEIADSVKPGSK